jgi:hypothetical protein
MGDLRDVIIGLDTAIRKSVVSLALDIHGELVESTPVDTGWARANWIPSVGTPVADVAGNPGSANKSAADAGAAEVLRSNGKSPIYITNNVPYIGRLNDGSSAQAPKGFVQKSIEKAVRK